MISNIWHGLDPSRVQPHDFIALIEISKGSKNKYELDKDTGLIILDRILHTSTHYPANYGLIPLTYADDYDPLDVLVLCSEPLDTMTLVRCYPIGVINMLDNGREDQKIIAIPFSDPTYNGYRSIFALPKHMYDEMTHFFSVYKMLEGKDTVIDEVMDEKAALSIIERSIDAYREKFGDYNAKLTKEARKEAEKINK